MENMQAFIIVVPNEYYTIMDENGNYEIKNVPAGKHTMVVWHESFSQKEFEIDVPETGNVELNIDF